MVDRPQSIDEHAARRPPRENPPELHWAGHRHVGGFLVQLGSLLAVKLAVWVFVFLMALRLLGEPMPWQW